MLGVGCVGSILGSSVWLGVRRHLPHPGDTRRAGRDGNFGQSRGDARSRQLTEPTQRVTGKHAKWLALSAALPARTRPRSASHSTAQPARRPRLGADLRGLRAAAQVAREAAAGRRAVHNLQRPRHVVLLRPLLARSRWASASASRWRTKAAGRARCRRCRASGAGRSTSAPFADGRRVRHVVLPGQAAGPRLLLAAVGAVRRRQTAGRSTIVPLQVGVLQFPIPQRRALLQARPGAAPRDRELSRGHLRVVIVATGGLSHQVHGERAGFNNTAWDAAVPGAGREGSGAPRRDDAWPSYATLRRLSRAPRS